MLKEATLGDPPTAVHLDGRPLFKEEDTTAPMSILLNNQYWVTHYCIDFKSDKPKPCMHVVETINLLKDVRRQRAKKLFS